MHLTVPCLPQLESTRSIFDPVVQACYFLPDCRRLWLVIEGCKRQDDYLFFGCTISQFRREWGYFWLSEMQLLRGPLGMPIERDTVFSPQRLSLLQV